MGGDHQKQGKAIKERPQRPNHKNRISATLLIYIHAAITTPLSPDKNIRINDHTKSTRLGLLSNRPLRDGVEVRHTAVPL